MRRLILCEFATHILSSVEDIHSQWDSIYDYLLCTKFGFDETTNQSTGKKQSNPTFDVLKTKWEKEPDNSHTMVLCLNDYPYYLESGIEHWILWKLGGHDVCDDEIEMAKYKILCHCIGIDDKDDRIDMKVDMSLITITLRNEDIAAWKFVHDKSIFLQWINPPHLKRLVASMQHHLNAHLNQYNPSFILLSS